MLKRLKKLILSGLLLGLAFGCEDPESRAPEPHLELGQ